MANDPNTIQYVIQEDGFWYVASKDRTPGVPEITVSAKGVANGLSEEYNDGWDFGPDSYSPTSTSAIPYTQTSGIREAVLYSESIAFYDTQYTGVYEYPKIHLGTGIFYISQATTITMTKPAHSIIIEGEGQNNTRLVAQSSVGNSNYVFTLNIAGGGILQINDMSWYFENSVSQGMFYWAPTSSEGVAGGLNLFNIENGSASQKYLAYFGGSGLEVAYVHNIQNEASTPLYIATTSACQISGGWTGSLAGYFEFGGSGMVYVANASKIIVSGTPYMVNAYSCTNITIDTNLSVINVFGGGSGGTILTLNSDVNTVNIFGVNTYGNSIISSGSSTVYNISSLNIIGAIDTGSTQPVLSNVTASAVFTSLINNFSDIPQNSPSTPSVPASGTAQQNTNPYPIKAYIQGGAITEIQITIGGTAYTVYSNSTASAVYEGFTLPAGASITLTYTTAPTWSWVPE